jgi:hypothetical protein
MINQDFGLGSQTLNPGLQSVNFSVPGRFFNPCGDS